MDRKWTSRCDQQCDHEAFRYQVLLVTYEEHALQVGSDSQACAYVGLEVEGVNGIVWGAGIKSDIIDASAYALISALNRSNHMNK